MNSSEHLDQLAAGAHRCDPSCEHFSFQLCWNCQRVEVEQPHLMCPDCLGAAEALMPELLQHKAAQATQRGEDGDQLYAQAGQYRTGPDRWRSQLDPELYDRDKRKGDDGPSEANAAELAAAEVDGDEWMRMVDPSRPWLMRTSDGGAWIQCAECDSWVQAEPEMTHEQATALAQWHRAQQWPHLAPRAQRQPRRRWWKGRR